MEDNVRYRRIFEFMLVFGLAIITLAVLMALLGSNAKADVIVDQGGNGDYLTIQEGIDNAIPGENVFVWDGLYNENITIDKSIQLIGNGSATTEINGFGTMNNIINITAEGGVITGFNITNSGNWYGIWANVGGFNIHDNVFDTQNWAIYMDITRLNSGSTTVGDIIVDNNEVIGTHGFHFNFEIEEPLSGSDFVFGKTVISNNTLYNTQKGIEMDPYRVFSMNQGSVTWSDIIVKNNYVNCWNSIGIEFYGTFWNITDVNIDLGKMEFSDNNVTAQSHGIYMDWWDFCSGIYGNTIITTQDTYVHNNDIVSQSSNGIYLQTDAIGDIIYDSTSITTGDFFIFSNNITTAGISSDNGIYLYMNDVAYYMYNDSSVNFGNIYIDSNFIDSNDYGIHFNYRDSFGTDAYDNALVNMGDVQVTNNEILSVNHGVYMSFDTVGNTMYDYASATLGSYYINNNNITSSNSDGISIYIFAMASSMHNEASFSIGDIIVDDNNILNAQNFGINIYFHESGWHLYDNSHVMFGNVLIINNNVTSNNDGIEYMLSSLAYDMYGTSSFYFSNSAIQNNIILYTGSEGIEVNYVSLGTELHDSATVTILTTIIESNNITATINGLVVNMDSLARDMHNASTFLMGDLTIGPNTINSTAGYSIIFQLFTCAYTMDGSASASFGCFSISGNNLLSAGIGIHATLSSVGYEMYDSASASIWGLAIDSNNITSGDQAIYVFVDFTARNIHSDSIFGMGDFAINHNTVNSTNSIGIEFHLQYSAYNMTGNATATFGNFLFTNNNIMALNSHGLWFVWYNIGIDMHDGTVVTTKELHLDDNTFECGILSYVIDWELDNIGNNMHGDSFFSLGDRYAEGNIILSGFWGIYVGREFWGNDMYDNSIFMYGDFFIRNNVINVTVGAGIIIDYIDTGENMAGTSSVSGGNISIINNIAASRDSEGIHIDCYYIGYNISDFSYVSTGWIDISYNNFSSVNNHGAYIWMDYLGAYMYGDSQAYIGDIMFKHNNVWSDTMDALNFNRFYRNAYMMYNDSYVQIGNVLVNDNNLNANDTGDGIVLFQWQENAYEMSHNASADFGNFEFNRNTITAGDGGIIMDNMGYWGNYLRGDNQVTFGHFFLNDNIINSSNGYGIRFGDWYDVGKEIYGQSVFTMGDIEITGNSISTIGTSGINVYMDSWAWRVYDNAEVHFGNFLFNDNIVNSTGHGININAILYWGADVHNNSLATFGNIEVNRNQIIAGSIPSGSNRGIYFNFYDNGYEMSENSSVNLGHIHLNDNTITCYDSNGIDINACNLAYTMTGTSSATFGDFSVSNNIIESQNQGIYCQFEYVGNDMHDMTTFDMGSIIVTNNSIISGKDPAATDSYGILFQSRYIGFEIHNESQATVGSILVNENTVTVVFGTNSHAIYINWISDYGAEMYDTATFIMNGNIEVCRNTINTTNGDEGIFCDVYNLGNFLYGDNTASYGDFRFNDNTIIEAYNDGMRILVNAIGYYIYGNSSVTIGNVQLNDNDILLFNGGYYAGIELYLYDLGAIMYDGSIFNMGHVQMNDNIIYCVNGLGFEVSAYRLGYQIYNSSSAYFGNFGILRNNITSKDWGIHFASFNNNAADLHNDTVVIFRNFLINNNIINITGPGTDDGISFDQPRYVGYEMYDQSYAELGNFEFNGNEIVVNSLADGIDFQPDNWGSYMYDNATFTIGDFNFIDNTITAGDNGIYFQPSYFGAYMYGNSTAIVGNNFITGNEIDVVDTSLYAWWWSGFGNWMYDYSYFEVGSCYIMFNNITSWSPTYYGIYTGPDYSGCNVYDESQAHFGDYIVSHNTVFSNGKYGIYLDYEGIGYYLDISGLSECRAVVEVGEIRLESNIITVPQGTGINVNGYDVAEELIDFASVNTTGIFIVNNTITAFDYGIYFGMEYFGYYLWNESQANLGPVVIEKNNITCTNGTGIKCFIYDNAYFIYNDARLSIDDIHLKQNTITASATGIDIVLKRCINIMDNSTVVFPGMLIADNLVDSAFSAFNYTTSETPGGVTGTATLLVGDVIIQGNTFDGGLFGMLFEWQNPDPTVQQPLFYINKCDIIGGSAGSKGLLLFNITDLFANQLTIDTFDYGIYSNNSHVHHYLNGSIENCAVLDISLYSASYLFMINSTFNNASVFFEDFDSQLDVAWFMNVLVQSQVALPVPEAIVAVVDVDGIEIFNASANLDGQAFYIICMEYQENITGIIKNYNDYTANATKGVDFGVATPDPTMNQTRLVIITLIDMTPPTIFGDNSDTSGTTGDPFYFEINASDNIGIVSVHINYQYNGAGPFTNRTMTGSGPYWLTEVLPPSPDGFIEYYFTAVDSGGFWVNTTSTIASVTDNDAPTSVWVSQPMTGTTGESVLVSIQATDNIGITYYKIDVDGVLYDLVQDGDYYNLTIDVPSDSLTDIIYSIILNDSANNPNSVPETTITVTDNDYPTYTWILQPTSGLSGGSVTISLIAVDNIEITNHTITINGTTYDMVKDGDYYNYTYIIPVGSTLDIPYSVTFLDGAGNSNSTLDTIINITGADDEPPTFTWILQPTAGTTGESVLLSLMATDNSAIAYYKIEIDGVLYDLTKDGDYYNYTINIPSDSLIDIIYKVIFKDTADNQNETLEITISVTDNDDPLDLTDDSDTTATTGDVFTFQFDASDNIGLVKAEIFYWFGTDTPTSEVISGSGPFTFTITILSDSLDELHYYIVIEDAAGNSITGSTTDVSVTDNDKPSDISDTSDTTATTGDDFTFDMTASDNIGVVKVEIYYWFGDGEETNLSITGSGPFTHTISLPEDTTDALHYYFVFIDAANNEIIGPQVDVTLTDNDPATISNDQTDTSGREAEEFTFQVDALDNIGVSQVRVAYWFGDDEDQKTFLTLNLVNGSYIVSFTPGEKGTLNYYFETTDSSGNIYESDQRSVQIASKPKAEDDEPVILPWILIILIIIVILIFFFLMTKRKKEEEPIPEDEEGIGMENAEVEGFEEGEDIEIDSSEESGLEGDIEKESEPESEKQVEPEVESEEQDTQEMETEKTSTEDEPKDDIDRIIEEISEKDEN